MEGTSKVIMGATLVMLVSLAVILGLILVLLAELYCSLLLRRHQQRISQPTTASAAAPSSTISTITSSQSTTTTLSSFYSHGVLNAPRNFLFPCIEQDNVEITKKQSCDQLHQVVDIETQVVEVEPMVTGSSDDKTCQVGENVVYISNPIYDNDQSRPSCKETTPFETPSSSPSKLERSDFSSGEDEIEEELDNSSNRSLSLSPMMKLPAEACSVPLRHVRSLGSFGSDSFNSNNGVSLLSSGSPSTSPSW